MTVLWRLMLLVASLVVAVGHGPALRRLGLGRRRFTADVMTSSRTAVSAILNPRPATLPGARSGTV